MGKFLKPAGTRLMEKTQGNKLKLVYLLERRNIIRERILTEQEDGQASYSGSTAPGTAVEL